MQVRKRQCPESSFRESEAMRASDSSNQIPGGAVPTLRVRTFQTHDFDEIAAVMSHGNAEFRQMSGGYFLGEFEAVQIGECRLLRVAVNRMIQARGRLFQNNYAIALITPHAVKARWLGQTLQTGQIRVVGPEEEADHLSGIDYEILTIVVNPAALRQAVMARSGIDLDDLLNRKIVVTPAAEAFERLEAFVRCVLLGARSYPPRLTEAGNMGQLEAECLHRVAAALTSSPSGSLLLPFGSRDRIVRLADDFLQWHLDEPLSILDLHREIGVSERTLRYAFQQRFGMGPKAYLKKLQLNAVRHALKKADPNATTVHAVAQRWGFWHTGAFSADYRSLFGELPSETLGE
jgi:AraC family ethanolamine operon transcriptional activator